MFNSVRINTLSQISRDIGQIFFASMFIAPITTGTADLKTLAFGLLFSLLSWSGSLLLVKE